MKTLNVITIIALLISEIGYARNLSVMTDQELMDYRAALQECKARPEEPCLVMQEGAPIRRTASAPYSTGTTNVTVNNNLPSAPATVVEERNNSNWLLWTVIGIAAGGAGTYYYMRNK